jgi:hypothetical protein
MTTKSILRITSLGVLGLAGLGIATAKSYDITLVTPTMAGSTELKPGDYKLKVEGTEAVFTDVQTSKSWKAPVKIENGNQKFDDTRIESSNQGEMAHIQAIDLGGSTTKLEFGQ